MAELGRSFIIGADGRTQSTEEEEEVQKPAEPLVMELRMQDSYSQTYGQLQSDLQAATVIQTYRQLPSDRPMGSYSQDYGQLQTELQAATVRPTHFWCAGLRSAELSCSSPRLTSVAVQRKTGRHET